MHAVPQPAHHSFATPEPRGWNRELDKMAGWGTKYTDRDALLEYLVATYGDDKPVAPPEMSEDGRTK